MSMSEKELKARIALRKYAQQVIKEISAERNDLVWRSRLLVAPQEVKAFFNEQQIMDAFEKALRKAILKKSSSVTDQIIRTAKKIPKQLFMLKGALTYEGDKGGIQKSVDYLRKLKDSIADKIDDVNEKLYATVDDEEGGKFFLPVYIHNGPARHKLLRERKQLKAQLSLVNSRLREVIRLRRILGAEAGIVEKAATASKVRNNLAKAKQKLDDVAKNTVKSSRRIADKPSKRMRKN